MQMGQTEAQRGHTAQFVDLRYLLDNTLLKQVEGRTKKKSDNQGNYDNGGLEIKGMFVCLTLTSVASPCLMLLAQVHGSLFVSK